MLDIVEFTVAPYIAKGDGKSYHEWFIEFENAACRHVNPLHKKVDDSLREKNVYYDDLIRGNILESLKNNHY